MSSKSSGIHVSSCVCQACQDERDIVAGYRHHNPDRPHDEQWGWLALVMFDGRWSVWEVYDYKSGVDALLRRFLSATTKRGDNVCIKMVPSGAVDGWRPNLDN